MEYIKEKIKKENLLGYGTSRIVFDLGDGTVAKVPYNNLGILANRLEYEYFQEHKEVIAQVKKYKQNIIVQEKLYSIIVVPFEYTLNKNAEIYLKQNYPNTDFTSLLEEAIFSRLQIGFNKDGKPKFYDYEDSKVKYNFILPPFEMGEEWVKMFFDHYKKYDILKIEEHETFEDQRGFLVDYNDEK